MNYYKTLEVKTIDNVTNHRCIITTMNYLVLFDRQARIKS